MDGKARVLVDAGGGSALRFGESGAQMADLDVVLFTHLQMRAIRPGEYVFARMSRKKQPRS